MVEISSSSMENKIHMVDSSLNENIFSSMEALLLDGQPENQGNGQ